MTTSIARIGALCLCGWVLMPALTASADAIRADSHAPIGVMGDHTHKAGEYMFSYRFMTMNMQGNRSGSDSISPTTIATTIPNRFFGSPMQPPTLRVVPLEMRMDMHMFGMMYAPTSWLTLMGMTSYVDKTMDHVTFQGGAGTATLGEFTTDASGLGDTSLVGLFSLDAEGNDRLHASLGLSFPTGSITETDTVLAPTGMRPELRLPYPMQLGSGSIDIIAGLTYARAYDRFSYGGQWQSRIRTQDNDEAYRLGNSHQVSAWLSYLQRDAISWSLRATVHELRDIRGIDGAIRAPVQTADPLRSGGTSFALAAGVNLAGTGALTGHRLALELNAPVYQDLNGPQLETDYTLTLGYQRAY